MEIIVKRDGVKITYHLNTYLMPNSVIRDTIKEALVAEGLGEDHAGWIFNEREFVQACDEGGEDSEYVGETRTASLATVTVDDGRIKFTDGSPLNGIHNGEQYINGVRFW